MTKARMQSSAGVQFFGQKGVISKVNTTYSLKNVVSRTSVKLNVQEIPFVIKAMEYWKKMFSVTGILCKGGHF